MLTDLARRKARDILYWAISKQMNPYNEIQYNTLQYNTMNVIRLQTASKTSDVCLLWSWTYVLDTSAEIEVGKARPIVTVQKAPNKHFSVYS